MLFAGLAPFRGARLSSNVRRRKYQLRSGRSENTVAYAAVPPSSNPDPRAAQSQLALRVGAASIYLPVGLVIGLVVALVDVALSSRTHPPPLAGFVFGTAALAVLLAAAFPVTAMESLSALAHLVWGLVNGLFISAPAIGYSTTPQPEPRSTPIEQWLFWLGFFLGCAVLAAWKFYPHF